MDEVPRREDAPSRRMWHMAVTFEHPEKGQLTDYTTAAVPSHGIETVLAGHGVPRSGFRGMTMKSINEEY
jgi:hypothetical protein